MHYCEKKVFVKVFFFHFQKTQNPLLPGNAFDESKTTVECFPTIRASFISIASSILLSVVLIRALFTVSIRTIFSLPIVPSGPSSLCKKNKFPHISFSFSFHLLQIALHCVGAQHIFLGEWERESGALMEFAHFQNILNADNFPFGSFGLIYKSASLMLTTTTTM